MQQRFQPFQSRFSVGRLRPVLLALNHNTIVFIQTVFQDLPDSVFFPIPESGTIGKMKKEGDLCIYFVYILTTRTAAAGKEKRNLPRLKFT